MNTRKELFNNIISDTSNQTEAFTFVSNLVLESLDDIHLMEFWNSASIDLKIEIVTNLIMVQNTELKYINETLQNISNKTVKWWLVEHCIKSYLQSGIKIKYNEGIPDKNSKWSKNLSFKYVHDLEKNVHIACDLINITYIQLIWLLTFDDDKSGRQKFYTMIVNCLHGGKDSCIQWCSLNKFIRV